MSAMLNAVKPGGTVFVEVPGIVDGAPPPAVLINRHHQWYFTEATMRRLVEKCGGEVRQVSRVGPSIHELRTLSAAGERMGRRWKTIKDVMPEFFVRAARGILRPHKERLTRALAQQERGPADPSEQLPLNLCVFSRPASKGRS
jgi:hypothetical protein